MSAIIVRATPENKKVVFLLDTLNFQQRHIDVYHPDTNEITASNLDFYKMTKSVSDAEEASVANTYVQRFGMGADFKLRRKLFRSSIMEKMATEAQPAPTTASLVNKKETLEKAVEAVKEAVKAEDEPPYSEEVFQRKLLAAHLDFKRRLLASLARAIEETI